MAGYCTSVQPYFHKPQASENTAQECNIQPYYLLTHQIIDLLYTTLIQQHLKDRQLLCKHNTKVVAACIFNKLPAAGLFLALDGTSMHSDPSTSGRKYLKSVNNAVVIHNESLVVSQIVYTFGMGLETSHVIPYYRIVTVTCAPCCAWGEDEDRTVSVYQ